jgi:hypothetical protein
VRYALVIFQSKIFFFDTTWQFIKKKAKTAPRSVKINGIFFKIALKNSESIKLKPQRLLNIEFPKIGLPKPIKRSRVK